MRLMCFEVTAGTNVAVHGTNYFNLHYSLHDSDTVFLHIVLRLCPDRIDPCPDFLSVFWT
jgi:hypothetical protein